jgi:hypothetical protein
VVENAATIGKFFGESVDAGVKRESDRTLFVWNKGNARSHFFTSFLSFDEKCNCWEYKNLFIKTNLIETSILKPEVKIHYKYLNYLINFYYPGEKLSCSSQATSNSLPELRKFFVRRATEASTFSDCFCGCLVCDFY